MASVLSIKLPRQASVTPDRTSGSYLSVLIALKCGVFHTMMFMQSTLKPQFLLTLVASCVVVSCLARAQHMNAPDSPCQKPASNAEITSCFISASKTADERLNTMVAFDWYCLPIAISNGIFSPLNACG